MVLQRTTHTAGSGRPSELCEGWPRWYASANAAFSVYLRVRVERRVMPVTEHLCQRKCPKYLWNLYQAFAAPCVRPTALAHPARRRSVQTSKGCLERPPTISCRQHQRALVLWHLAGPGAERRLSEPGRSHKRGWLLGASCG